MSSPSGAWSDQLTPESTPLSRSLSDPPMLVVDDWEYWSPQVKVKKGHSKKVALNDNPSSGEIPPSASVLANKSQEFRSGAPTAAFSSSNRPQPLTRDGRGHDYLEQIMKAVIEKLEETKTNSDSKPTSTAALPSKSGALPSSEPLLDETSRTSLPRDIRFNAGAPSSNVPEPQAVFPSTSFVSDHNDRKAVPPLPFVSPVYQNLEARQFHSGPQQAKIHPMDGSTFYDDRRPRYPRVTSRVRSRSPSPSTLSDSSSIDDRNDERVNSHSELIPCSVMGDLLSGEDLTATLAPFRRKVYVSYHDPTSVDFKQYIVLLKYAQTDCWYTFPNQNIVQSIKEREIIARLQGAEPNLQRILEHMPLVDNSRASHFSNSTSIEITRVNAGRALRINDDMPKCSCKQRPRTLCKTSPCTRQTCECRHARPSYPCEDCRAAKRLPRTDAPGMRYLSVVQAYRDGYSPGTGVPIYKVVETGSRTAAAAQAFFDAGAHGWSTVFVCAVPARVSLAAETLKYADVLGARHAVSMDEVLVHDGYHGKEWMRVLY